MIGSRDCYEEERKGETKEEEEELRNKEKQEK